MRLPAAVAREAHLHADQRVRVSVEDGRVVHPPEDAPPTLEQRLARFDPARHGGEVMTVVPEASGGSRSKTLGAGSPGSNLDRLQPQAGREMRDPHPFVVLSPRVFNERTSLVIGLPMTTAEYNADNPFAVMAGSAKTGKASYVLCH